MANLIKIGSSVLKSGSNVLSFNKSQSIGLLLGGVGGFSNLGLITVDTPGNRLFLCSSNGGMIYILDLTTYSVINTSLSGHAVALDAANKLFVSNDTNTKVYNATTYALISTIPIKGNLGIAFGYGKIYLRSSNTNVTVIDSTTFTTITSFNAVNNTILSKGIRCDQINNRLFAYSWVEGIKVYNATTFDYIGIFGYVFSSCGVGINNGTNRIMAQYGPGGSPTYGVRIMNLVQPFTGQLDTFSSIASSTGIEIDDTRVFLCNAATLYIYSNLYS